VARTVTLELLAPSLAKQQAFKRLQGEFNRVANEVASAVQQGSAEAARALDSLFPSGWDHPVVRMIQGQLRAAAGNQGRSPLPRFKPRAPVVFGETDWTLTNIEGKWKLTLPVFGRTIQVPVLVPQAQSEALSRLVAGGIPMEGRLFQRRGRWYFAATFLNEVAVKGDRPVVGVDLGRRLRAVMVEPTSNHRQFLSGRAHEHRLRRYDRAIARLSAAGQLRSAARVRAKRDRYAEAADRQVANAIVAFARDHDRAVIKFERFSSQTAPGQRPEVERYRRIQRLVSRKAERCGLPVVAVSGFDTSQRCYACGSVQPGNRRGRRYRCGCGYHAHADLNAARNVAQTAIWSEAIQLAAGGYNPAGQAEGTAASQVVGLIKGETDRLRSAIAQAVSHALPPTPPALGVASHTHSNQMEGFEMASLVKDLTESSTKFVTGSLDNLKTYVDRTSEEVSRVDFVGVTRRVLDTAIDNTKKVVKLTSEPNGLDFFGKAKAVADGSLEAAKEVVTTISEEGKKADLLGVSTRVTMEGLASLRNQVDLTLDTTKTITNRLMPIATGSKPVATRAPQVTRVEVEHEKPAATSGKASK
jgi:hypothetical protein